MATSVSLGSVAQGSFDLKRDDELGQRGGRKVARKSSE